MNYADYLLGLSTPFAFLLIIFLLGQIKKFFKRWLFPLPLISWFGMMLTCIGLHLVQKRHCDFRFENGKIYVSPRVKAFKEDEINA